MKNIDIAITNVRVLTMNNAEDELLNATVLIHNDRIEGIFANTDWQKNFVAKEIFDGTNKLLLPGLVNTHTHAPMMYFRGLADDLPLEKWLNDEIFPIEKKFVTVENVKNSIWLAIAEMQLSGTTTFSDMYYFEKDIALICKKANMRAVLFEGLLDFPTPNSPTPEISLEYSELLLDLYKNDDLISIGVGPHAPYTCSAATLQKSKELARKYNAKYQIHLAETLWEFNDFLQKYNLTPTAYLHSLGVFDGNTIGAHSIHLNEADIELFASCKAGVAHNPECNMKLASGAAPIQQLIDRGVVVGLGTDGVGSNNNLDMFEEMHTVSLFHKHHQKNPTVLNAKTVVKMATIEGAKLLGLQNVIGSVEVGKKADLILIDLNKPHLTPIYNIYSHLVYAIKSSDVETVFVNGKVVVKNRILQNIDIQRAIEGVNRIAEEVKLFKLKG